ncbi:MAG TPA: substrate-binding domain-containing protein, partial [Acidimicrobiales bacterium]|nr:substrate-binding domain-containing protein [Acidimicrobiales bacterium]
MSRRNGLPVLLAAGLVAGTGIAGGGLAAGGTAGAASKGPSTLPVTSFTSTFKMMTHLKSLAAAGKGKVAVILPDTTSSTRYVEFDAPLLSRAFSRAGLKPSQYIIQNAQGSDTTALTDAQTDITNGATVLLVDPKDSGVGGSIEKYAKSHGVAVIDYDRLTLGGSRAYYVSFNNVEVGKL